MDCSALESLEIPNTVTSIGNNAFYGCKDLLSIEIPKSITTIGESAFRGCSGLKRIEIPESISSIKKYAFSGCSGLTSIAIPNSVTIIGNNAFEQCDNLKEINLNEGLEEIGDYAFKGTKIETLEIPSTLKKIGRDFLDYSYYNLKSVNLHDLSAWLNVELGNEQSSPFWHVSYDNGHILLNNEEFTELIIPDGVTEVKNYAFYCCRSLKSITLGNDIKKIGSKAFCATQIEELNIGDGVEEIGYQAFAECSQNLKSIHLGKNVKKIGALAFYWNENLEKINFPASLQEIGYSVFQYCNKLSEINIEDLHSWFNVKISGNFFPDFIPTILVNGETITHIEVPTDITEIKDYTLCGFRSVTSINIPDNINKIGMSSFERTGITSVEIPNSVTSIGKNAFYNCGNLESAVMPNSVQKIDNQTFWNCRNLKNLTLPETLLSIGHYAFAYSGLEKIVIPGSVNSIGSNPFRDCTKLNEIQLKECEKYYLDRKNLCSSDGNLICMFGNDSIVSVPRSIKYIMEYAGTSLSNLKELNIYDNVRSIGSYAFESTGVEKIYNYSYTPQNVNSYSFPDYFRNNHRYYIYVPNSAHNDYNQYSYWAYFNINPMNRNMYVTMPSDGLMSFDLDYAADLYHIDSGEKGVVFYAKEISNENEELKISLEELHEGIPRNNGVILKGQPGRYLIVESSEKDKDIENLLIGTTEDNITFGNDGYYYYKLTYADASHNPNTLGFYLANADGTIDAKPYKAYLKLPQTMNAAKVRLMFDDEATAIEDVRSEDNNNKAILYNLQGVRVDNGYKGIVIKNGKKVIY